MNHYLTAGAGAVTKVGGVPRSWSPSMAHIETHSHIRGIFMRKEGVMFSSFAARLRAASMLSFIAVKAGCSVCVLKS